MIENDYETVVGLEIHCQLNTDTKVFSGEPYGYGASPNSQVGPVTMALPGTLPVFNKKVLELAIQVGLALECNIANITKFDRKHYFYPDLPKGYQITQLDMPYAIGGVLFYKNLQDRMRKKVRIHHIHIEEDAGKLLHNERDVSYVDLNRAGSPLIEIVTEPDLSCGEDAYGFLQTLQNLIQSTGAAEANMEEGSLRCDANVSVKKKGATKLGTRTEIKNLNSFKAVRASIEYESIRQIQSLEAGNPIIQSTMLWDADQQKTRVMRVKEDAEDYRYFPEPDILPIAIKQSWVDELRRNLPELPEKKKQRYMQELQLPEYDAEVLTQDNQIAYYFEEVYAICKDAKKSSNWVKDEVLGVLSKNQEKLANFPCNAHRLGSLITLLNENKITSKLAKTIFEHIYKEDMDPKDIIEKYDYKPTNIGDLTGIVKQVIDSNTDNVQKILAGNERVKGFLVGQVMKATKGQAPPNEVNELIDKHLLLLRKQS